MELRVKRSVAERGTSLVLFLLVSVAITANAQTSENASGTRKVSDEKPPASGTKAPVSIKQHYEKEGISIDFSVSLQPGTDPTNAGLVAGAHAIASFQVKDLRTGQPITNLHPSAWFTGRKNNHAANEVECKDNIRTLLGGLLSVRADIDLNSYVMLTLNHDKTISVINPQISFSVTKLENLIVLPAAGADWALSNNKEFLYVTLPDASSVSIINTITRKVIDTISTGDKTKPRRIALQPDGRYAWIGLDDNSRVAVIDTKTNKLVDAVETGKGLHAIAFIDDSRYAYVTNSASDNVSVIDTNTLKKIADISVGKTPAPIAYSSASHRIYVAAINGGDISVIDPSRQQVVATIPGKLGVVALRFEPQGRYGFAVNQIDSKVMVFDAATNSAVGSIAVTKEPDQIAFTRLYAYIHGTASEKFSLVELSEVRQGKFTAIDIQAGQRPPNTLPDEIGIADMIAPTPEGNSVMIANAPDQEMFYYVEGMMAPMGTFSNYNRRPHALILIDRSLSETAPGVYSAPIKLSSAGRFDVPLLIDQPRLSNCFQVEVADSPNGEKHGPVVSMTVESGFANQRFKPGEKSPLTFKLVDSVTKQPITGLKDVEVLTFEPPGIWQERQWANEISPGVYQVTQLFPHVAGYRVMVSVPSRGVRFVDLPSMTVIAINNQIDNGAADGKKPDK